MNTELLNMARNNAPQAVAQLLGTLSAIVDAMADDDGQRAQVAWHLVHAARRLDPDLRMCLH
jgi:hypothetical protein